MYDIARGVWDAAVLPIGCGVLGLVFTVKLIQISQRMDGNASFPGVKEVVFLLVFFAVFLFLIQNSFDLMASIYEVCGLAIDRVEALFGAGGALDLPEIVSIETDHDLRNPADFLVINKIAKAVVAVPGIAQVQAITRPEGTRQRQPADHQGHVRQGLVSVFGAGGELRDHQFHVLVQRFTKSVRQPGHLTHGGRDRAGLNG